MTPVSHGRAFLKITFDGARTCNKNNLIFFNQLRTATESP
jgi:hypothetical protein